jgi:hypothetical protein
MIRFHAAQSSMSPTSSNSSRLIAASAFAASRSRVISIPAWISPTVAVDMIPVDQRWR